MPGIEKNIKEIKIDEYFTVKSFDYIENGKTYKSLEVYKNGDCVCYEEIKC